jgi:ribosome-binding factor A
VQRALNLALADCNAADDIGGLFIDDVSPAPDCGRLLVQVLVPEGRLAADTIGALFREAPRLRSEVAMAITRKRAPELSFVPVVMEGGGDE